MAQTAAERQARYRRRRPDAGDNGDRRLDIRVTTGTALARHQNVPQRDIFIGEADPRCRQASPRRGLSDAEWTDYMRIAVTG